MAIDPDLFAAVVEALDGAMAELVTLRDECGGDFWPVPDDLQKLLDQRDALAATLARVCKGFVAQGKPATAERVRALYVEELAKADARYSMPNAPVDGDVVAKADDALERVRRAVLVDGEVRDALDTWATV